MYDEDVVDIVDIIEIRRKRKVHDELPVPIAMIPMQTRMMRVLEMSYFVGIVAMFCILLTALVYTVTY